MFGEHPDQAHVFVGIQHDLGILTGTREKWKAQKYKVKLTPLLPWVPKKHVKGKKFVFE